MRGENHNILIRSFSRVKCLDVRALVLRHVGTLVKEKVRAVMALPGPVRLFTRVRLCG